MQLKIIATADVLKKQSFPTSVNDTSCANLNAKHAPLKASSNMKGYGNPLITIFYCKVLKKEGRPNPPPVSWKLHPWCLGICKMQMIYATKSFLVPEKQQWKASQKVSRDSGTIIFSGRTGQKDIYCAVFLRPWQKENPRLKGKKVWEKEGMAIQGEMFLFSSESLAEEYWACRDSSNSNYFEMSEVNKMKSWNASRSWKWDIKLLKILTFLQENYFSSISNWIFLQEYINFGWHILDMPWCNGVFWFINIINL